MNSCTRVIKRGKEVYKVNFHDGSCSFLPFNLAHINDIVELLTDEIYNVCCVNIVKKKLLH